MQNQRHGKRMLKLAISLLVYLADRSWMCLRWLSGGKCTSSFVVLSYHSVSPRHRALFAGQMDTLLRYATPVGAGAEPGQSEGRRYAAVTFDDAFENLVNNALPELNRRNIPCTIFVVTETLGKAANWEDIGETHGNEKVMTLDHVRTVSSALVRFGAHTMTHPVLTSLDEQAARKEIFESRVRLQELVGREIPLFSFPYGASNHRLVCLCREAGYERVFTTLPAPVRAHEFVVGRTPVEPTESKLEFHLKLFGAYRWVAFASSLKARAGSLVGRLKAPGRPAVVAPMVGEKRPS